MLGLKVVAWGGYYPTITGPLIVCANSSSLFTLSTAAAIGLPSTLPYAWTFPTGWASSSTTTANIQSGIAGPLATSGIVIGNIQTVAGTNTLCYASAQFSVTVPPPLSVTASPSVICKGSTSLLNASGGIPNTYSWVGGGVPQFNGNPYTCMPQVSTTYTVSAQMPNSICIHKATKTVSVIFPPNISIAGPNSPICAGTPTSLTAILSPGPAAGGPWLWTPATNPNQNPQNISPTVTTVYNISLKGQNGCIATVVKVVTVAPTPTLTVVSSPSVTCPFNQASLTAFGANTYTWNSPIANNVNPFVVNPFSTTTYTVKGTSSNGCVATKTVQQQVFSLPQVTVNPAVICPGITTTLTAGGAMSYTWFVMSNGLVYLSNSPTITVNPTTATSYMLMGTAVSGCIGTTTFVIQGGPPSQVAASNVTLCSSSASCTTMSVTSTFSSPASYTWMPLAGGSALTGSIVTVCPNANATTIYSIYATSQAGCPASGTMAVTTVSNCCSQPTAGLQVLSALSGTYANGSYLINSPIMLSGNTHIQEAEFWMTPGVLITVPSGTVLNFDKAHLFACSNVMWKGIVVKDGGRVTTSNIRKHSTLIEDAEIAISLNSVSLYNSGAGTPPVDIEGIIFNKNYIGISISNAVPGNLILGVNGCVFSSRTLSFSTFPALAPFSWPNGDMLANGLRFPAPATPTTGLAPPYNFNLMPQTNSIKIPYSNQPAHIGIQIKNTNLVNIGVTSLGFIQNNFNLYDGIGRGIEVSNGSLVTKNNVFQNIQFYYPTPLSAGYGGEGIYMESTNAYPYQGIFPGVTYEEGNRFYNCITGIVGKNTGSIAINRAIFRSTHQVVTPIALTPLPGNAGVFLETNRFNLSVTDCQFNNLKNGIVLQSPSLPTPYYDPVSANTLTGIDGNLVGIQNNYFGPEVLSATPYSGSGQPNSSEYMAQAIRIETPNTTGWLSSGAQAYITSNRIDRSFRGISVYGTEDWPLTIANNSVFIEEDYTFGLNPFTPAFGYGIAAEGKMDNLSITNNTVVGTYPNVPMPFQNSVSLVYCKENFGNASPSVRCNTEVGSHYGFEFEGKNPNTVWEGNEMCSNFAGLALTNSAVIGTQGTPNNGCGNVWATTCAQPWGFGFAQYYTFCDNSDPLQSLLWGVNGNIPNFWNPAAQGPAANGCFPTPPIGSVYDFNNGIDYAPSTNIGDCIGFNPYGTPPAWRQASQNVTGSAEVLSNTALSIFPNPSSGLMEIAGSISGELAVSVFSISGKLQVEKTINAADKIIDLHYLAPGLYLVDIQDAAGKTRHFKIVKTN